MASDNRGVVFLLSKDGSTTLILDATVNMTYNRSASLAKNTLQTGVKVADHYHPDMPRVTFSGVITDSKIRENSSPSVVDYVSLIEDIINTATVFTLFGTGDGSIPSLDNCVIMSFDITKGTSNLNSLEVVITVEQINFGMRATLDSLTATKVPAKTTEGQLAPNSETKTGTGTIFQPTQAGERKGIVPSPRINTGT